ncbi:MAG: hypothetical protein Q9164_007373, partial [Protoblastenia rupestris]
MDKKTPLPASSAMDATQKYAAQVDKLVHITRHADELSDIKIENAIGFAQIPIGVAGPLTIHGHHQTNTVVAPIATVEAAVIATTARGCKAFQACGGIKAYAMREGMGRAPVFFFDSVDDAVGFYKRLPEFQPQLKKDAEMSSRFARLLRLTPHLIGKTVHVHFEFETGDAAGQNMTEIATATAIAKFSSSLAAKEVRLVKVNVEGHMSIDKTGAGARAMRNPRGVTVQAWGTLTDEVCRKILRCSTADVYRTLHSSKEGDIRSSNDGSSVNVSNAIAGLFIATGQDAASVVESSWAHLTLDFDFDGTRNLTFTLFFPSLIVGSVGGGTVYPTQKEGLEMIGCAGPGRKWALAETIAAFALVGD